MGDGEIRVCGEASVGVTWVVIVLRKRRASKGWRRCSKNMWNVEEGDGLDVCVCLCVWCWNDSVFGGRMLCGAKFLAYKIQHRTEHTPRSLSPTAQENY